MLTIRELTLTGIVIRILVSILLGGIIGLERGMKNRPAGLRTYMLVCMGSCVVMLINQYTTQVFGTGDPVRLGAQVISGIGFLGAGTIVVTSHNQIKGLTTAAGLWASACIGLAIGIGLYEVAIVAGVGVFLVLTVLHECDYYMRSRTRMVDVYIELEQTVNLGKFIRNIRDMGLEISNIQREHDTAYGDEVLPYIRQAGEKYFLDLKEINALVLGRAGVRHIEISTDCTMCRPDRFWSHRVTGGIRGSQGALILCKSKEGSE